MPRQFCGRWVDDPEVVGSNPAPATNFFTLGIELIVGSKSKRRFDHG